MSLKKTPVAGPIHPTTTLSMPSSYAAIPSSNRGTPAAQATKVAAPASKPLPQPPVAAAKPAANVQTPNDKIIALVKAGNLVEVQKMLVANPQLVIAKDRAGRDLRLIAGINGHVSLLEFFNEMQKKQPGLFADKRDGSHIINEMISFGDVALAAVQWFIAQGVTPNTKITQYALNDAANMSGEQTLAFLRTKITTNDLKIPAQVKKPQPFAKELFEAAEAGDTPMIEFYCQQGANIKLATYGPGSALPITTAAACGQADAVQWFVKTKGVDPTVTNGRNQNLMYVAAQHNHVGMMRVCKEFKIDPFHEASDEKNAFASAVVNGQKDAAEFIINEYKLTKDIYLKITTGNLCQTFWNEYPIQYYKWLLSKFDSTEINNISVIVFHRAASYGNVPILRMCRDLFPNLDLNSKHKLEWGSEIKVSAMGSALRHGHEDAIRYLVEECKLSIETNIERADLEAAKSAGHTAATKYVFAKLRAAKAADTKVAVVMPVAAPSSGAEAQQNVVGTNAYNGPLAVAANTRQAPTSTVSSTVYQPNVPRV